MSTRPILLQLVGLDYKVHSDTGRAEALNSSGDSSNTGEDNHSHEDPQPESPTSQQQPPPPLPAHAHPLPQRLAVAGLPVEEIARVFAFIIHSIHATGAGYAAESIAHPTPASTTTR